MQYVTLGKTGLQVSRLGLGGIPIQKADVKRAKELLERMVQKGMNYIDSARGYTVSEDYLGQALEGLRGQIRSGDQKVWPEQSRLCSRTLR